MSTFRIGQRWISEPEPELGLGTIVKAADDRVHVLYPATDELRVYAEENAPVRRVTFRAGEEVEDHDGTKRVIESVRDADGVLTYCGAGWELPEAQLSDRISFHGPEDRLRGGHFDDATTFELRCRALEMMHCWRQSPVRGFIGGRIELIPHQLYIAHEVSTSFHFVALEQDDQTTIRML